MVGQHTLGGDGLLDLEELFAMKQHHGIEVQIGYTGDSHHRREGKDDSHCWEGLESWCDVGFGVGLLSKLPRIVGPNCEDTFTVLVDEGELLRVGGFISGGTDGKVVQSHSLWGDVVLRLREYVTHQLVWVWDVFVALCAVGVGWYNLALLLFNHSASVEA